MPFRRLRMVAASWVCFVGLLIAPSAHAVTVTLIWTAPGDDGYTGQATAYDLRYAPYPITEQNFYDVPRYRAAPAPRPGGSLQFVAIGGLPAGVDYYFALKTCDERGNWSAMSNLALHTSPKVDIGDGPTQLAFLGPWPNPTQDPVRFGLTLPETGQVVVRAFDVSGRLVRELVEGELGAGRHDIVWDLREQNGVRVRPGLYLVSAAYGSQRLVRRVMVVR